MTGFSLSLPWAVAEPCMTGQPASALRSTPWGLSGVVSWLSVMANLSSVRVGLTRCRTGVSRGDGGAGGARGAQAPVGDLGLVDDEAVGVGGVEARAHADGAVDVGDDAARAADHVVVVVADAQLVARDRAGRLDPPDQPGVGERPEDVVDRLVGDGRLLRAHRGQDAAGVGVRLAAYGPQHGEPRPGDPQVSAAEQVLEVVV